MSRARLALPPVPASAARARQFVDDTLRGWGCDAFVDVARLLVGEFATNAVLHARTDMTLTVAVTRGGVRVEVHDGSTALPVQRNYEDEAMTGRGLGLLDQMADRWGVEPSGDGKAVWFELDT